MKFFYSKTTKKSSQVESVIYSLNLSSKSKRSEPILLIIIVNQAKACRAFPFFQKLKAQEIEQNRTFTNRSKSERTKRNKKEELSQAKLSLTTRKMSFDFGHQRLLAVGQQVAGRRGRSRGGGGGSASGGSVGRCHGFVAVSFEFLLLAVNVGYLVLELRVGVTTQPHLLLNEPYPLFALQVGTLKKRDKEMTSEWLR